MVEAQKPIATANHDAAPAEDRLATIEAKVASYQAQQMVHPRTLFSYNKDNTVKEGDTVIIFESHALHKQVVVKRGQSYTAAKGAIKHDDLIDNKERYGVKVFTTNKRAFVTILRPTSDMYTRNLAQRTQILYTPDISNVLMRLELRPGVKICESGTGSGSLSCSIIKSVMPTGHLWTFEFSEDRVGKAKTDFTNLGFKSYVTVTHRDVLSNGFLLEATDNNEGGVQEGSMDAVFLDLPRPHIAVEHAFKVLRRKGKLCNFSPCIEQVQRASQEMAKLGFYNIVTIECLARELQTRKHQYIPLTKPTEEQKAAAKAAAAEKPEDNKKKPMQKSRKQKQKDKEQHKITKLVSLQQPESRGHTGYLTFATKF